MRWLSVYESLCGDVERIAHAGAAKLTGDATADVTNSDVAPLASDGYDRLVIGGSNHVVSVTRATTAVLGLCR
jgi:menaquinone-dependent protoporphyrinogen IX oxidase